MRWRDDPVLRRLDSFLVEARPDWGEVSEALARAGAAVLQLPDFHLAVLIEGRLAWFQHATQGRMRRYQVRMLRDVLEGGDSPSMESARGLRHGRWGASVSFEPDDALLVGRVLGTDDAVGFHDPATQHVGRAFRFAAASYEAACRAFERPPQGSHSGRLLLRMRPHTHARAAQAARVRGMSLNAWISEAVMRTAAAELRRV